MTTLATRIGNEMRQVEAKDRRALQERIHHIECVLRNLRRDLEALDAAPPSGEVIERPGVSVVERPAVSVVERRIVEYESQPTVEYSDCF